MVKIPEGMNPNAAASWPPAEMIESFLGTEFEFRLGEDTPVADDPAALARARQFRDVMGLFCTGVTVVTSISNGEPVGMTCQSFSSVSLDPQLILFCPAKTSRAWPLMQRAGFFCVNFLGVAQQDISNQMATKGSDKFQDVAWKPASTGAPLLAGAAGFVDCTVHAVYEAGDHYVVIGRVQQLGAGDQVDFTGDLPEPLLFHQGRYRLAQ